MARVKDGKLFILIFIVSLLLNLVAAIYAGKKLYKKYEPVSNGPVQRPQHYHLERDKLLAALPSDSNAIVFLGNSLTQYFELTEFFPGYTVKNRGIHGDDIQGALQRLTPVINQKPKKIFLEFGSNDFDFGLTPDEIITAYKHLLDTLRRTCPQARLYIQSLLPNTALNNDSLSNVSMQRNKAKEVLNEKLKLLAQQTACVFADAWPQFVRDGQMDAGYVVYDGLHLSGKGYALWAKILKPYVEE